MPEWLTSGTLIDWIALLGSFIAIGLSIFALRQGARFRSLDRQTDAAKLVAEIKQRLEAVIVEAPTVKRDVRAMFAANGMLRSSICELHENQIEATASKAEDLWRDLERASADLRRLSGQALEERLVNLWSMKLWAEDLVGALDERKAECRKASEERQARAGKGVDRP